MTTLSTHDTKRSEDVRARLLVLAEIPQAWEDAVAGWQQRLGQLDPNTDYLLWQTLVGAFPISADRLHAYLEKATKEAKERTSWTEPDETFERALRERVDRLYADRELLDDVEQWVDEHLAAGGRSNSLAQKLVQLTMPGVPDVYQGQELPDLSLVDPDNRRPVDYGARRDALADVNAADAKLRVTAAALRLRRERPETFRSGGYEPVVASGAAADHALAFRRGDDVVTVVTRLPARLAARGGWGDTTLALPAGGWRDAVTGRDVTSEAVADILAELPVALLVRTDGEGT
jgi:(1->4)-alpha-D-glucan 1-alpha-D-glucosylmutase